MQVFLENALDLAGMELPFLITVRKVLCFGFVTSVDNRGMFQLLPSSTCPASRLFLFLVLPPSQQPGGG